MRSGSHLPALTSAALLFTSLGAAAFAAPPAPGQPVASCDAVVNGKCYVDGSFTLTATSPGAAYYKVCRSNDTPGWGGCDHVISSNTGSTITISGSDLPGEGFRRAYYFKACDASNSCSAWADNPEAYVQMDTTGPTAPGPSTVNCVQSGSECWAQGPFTVSVTAATDTGSGVAHHSFCRSNNSSGGFAGCDVGMAQVTSTSFLVDGANLPGPGSRRAYWVRAWDHVGNSGAWNTPRYVRVDFYDPIVSATNASPDWFPSRTATVNAADFVGNAAANSGIDEVRFRWNSPLNAACTNGTVTADGAVLNVPVGDNHLYLCAKDISGRLDTWDGGPYRVSAPSNCPIASLVQPKTCDSQLAAKDTVDTQTSVAPLSDFDVHQALYEDFVNYDMATVDPAGLRRSVDTAGKVQLTLAGSSHELILEPVEVRAPSYVATAVGVDGEVEVPRQPASTFRGRVHDDPESDVRLFISEDLVMGYVKVDDRRFFIDPADRYAKGGGAHRLVIYEDGDQRDTEGVSCGMTEAHQRAEELFGESLLDPVLAGNDKSGTLREMEVATDADYEYYDQHNGNASTQAQRIANTNNHILSVINMVNGLYAELNLQLTVVNQRVFIGAAADPYETCNVFGQWCEMWDDWTTNRNHIHRDLAHLFSGKRLYQSDTVRVRGTAGILGTVCDLDEAFSTSTPYREVGLVAHEMGHALNGTHLSGSTTCPDTDCLLSCVPGQPCNVDTCPDPNPAGGPVMCGSIQQPVTGFGSSVTQMSNYINGAGASCLSPVAVSSATYPWQNNANGSQGLNANWHYAMGYHFTPQVNGQITELGGLFNGTKIVKLFNSTGTVLAQTTVSGNNTWNYSSITPVNVQAGATYTVAVYLAGSGGSWRLSIDTLPRTYGDIRIEGSTFINTGGDPNARPTNSVGSRMYGQADVRFVPN